MSVYKFTFFTKYYVFIDKYYILKNKDHMCAQSICCIDIQLFS